jgi:hypothetical protein
MNDALFWIFLMTAVLAWPAVRVFSMWMSTRVRELELRERIAMIEKGLTPPPERDPEQFERSMQQAATRGRYPWPGGSGRHRRAGIVMMGVGLGLAVLISAAGTPRNGIGVGGFIAIIGLAFLVSSFFDTPTTSSPSSDSRPQPPSQPPAQS